MAMNEEKRIKVKYPTKRFLRKIKAKPIRKREANWLVVKGEDGETYSFEELVLKSIKYIDRAISKL